MAGRRDSSGGRRSAQPAPVAMEAVVPLPAQAAALPVAAGPVPKQPKETSKKKRAREAAEVEAEAQAAQQEERRLAEAAQAKQRKRGKASAKEKKASEADTKAREEAQKAAETETAGQRAKEARAADAYRPTARERAVEAAKITKLAGTKAAKSKVVEVAKANITAEKEPAQRENLAGRAVGRTKKNGEGGGSVAAVPGGGDTGKSSGSSDSSSEEEVDAELAPGKAARAKKSAKPPTKPIAKASAERSRQEPVTSSEAGAGSDESEGDHDVGASSDDGSLVQVISPQEAQLEAARFLVSLHKAGMHPPFEEEVWRKCFNHSSAIWAHATHRSGLPRSEAPSRGLQPTRVLWRAAQSLAGDIISDAAHNAASKRGGEQAPQAAITTAPAFPMVSHPSAGGATVMLKAPKALVVAVVFGNPPHEYHCSPASRLPVAAYLAAQYSGSTYCDVFGDKDAMDILGKRLRLDQLRDTAAQVILAMQTGRIQSFRHFAPTEGMTNKMWGPLSLRQLEKALDCVYTLFAEFLGLDTLFLEALRSIKKARWLEITYDAAVNRVMASGGSKQAAADQAGTHLLECLDSAMNLYQNQLLEILDEHFRHPDSTVGITGWSSLMAEAAPRSVTGIRRHHGDQFPSEIFSLSFWRMLTATAAFVPAPTRSDHHDQRGAHGLGRASGSKSSKPFTTKAPQPFTATKLQDRDGSGFTAGYSAGGLARAAPAAGGRGKSVAVPNPLVALPPALQTLVAGGASLRHILAVPANKAILSGARQVGSEDRLCHADLLFPGSCEHGTSCPFKHVVRAATV